MAPAPEEPVASLRSGQAPGEAKGGDASVQQTPVLQVKHLEIKYHTRDGILTALRNVSFDVAPGEIVGIVGESGCGKSTVATALLRLLPPNGEISHGQLIFQGRDLCSLDEEGMRQLRGKEISMIFQDPMTSLNPYFTIETQMLDALRAHHPGGNHAGLRQQAIQILDRVGIPDAARRLRQYPHQFSGGMRQRIMVGIALMSHPALLVADEPTSALDVTLEAQIVDLIRGLRSEFSTSILYITHDLGVVAQLCDRVIVMYAGNVVEAGDIFSVFETPQHPYTRALLRSHPSRFHRGERLVTIPGRVPSLSDLPPGCKFAPRCESAGERCRDCEPPYLQHGGQVVLCHSLQPAWAASEGTGHGDEEAGPASRPAAPVPSPKVERAGVSDKAVVEVKGLQTYFADRVSLLGEIFRVRSETVRAVDDVDLFIRRGETLALVGESGSGKTTLGRTILRLQDPTGGEIRIDERDITRMRQSALRPLRERMQMIFQDPCASLSPRMKVSSTLMEPYRIHRVPVDEKVKVDELLAMVGLSSEQAAKYPHQLSGGQARRVGIARALALNPDLLVADEPTAGLDVSVAAGVLNLLKDLRERLNLSYLIITHNLNIISFIADRVAVMYLGRIVEMGATDELFDHPQHPYTKALLSAIALPDPRQRDDSRRVILTGEIPSPRHPPSGCAFHPRCWCAQERCSAELPALSPGGGAGHFAACHFPLGY
jgi:peptide/nickel transport system ATP-binding protein